MNQDFKTILLVVSLMTILVVVGVLMGKGDGITGSAVAVGNIACYDDSDCNDRIEATKDVCKNPGTDFSLCVNRPI
jgi:hypothetical protein